MRNTGKKGGDMFMNVLSGLFNGVVIGSVMLVGLQFYPANYVEADTTGIQPNVDLSLYKNVDKDDYILETSLVTGVTQEDISCLTENMYHEARSDGYAGMYAVALVTLNRVADPRYPDTVCEVVYQGPTRESWKTRQHEDLPEEDRIYYPRRHLCQFSWYCDGKSDKMYDTEAFYQAVEIADMVLQAATGSFPIVDITEGSTHYHAHYVDPDWRHERGMTYISRIGQHLCYRWHML